MTDHAAIWGWREPTIDRDEVNLILRSLMRIEGMLEEIRGLLGGDDVEENES